MIGMNQIKKRLINGILIGLGIGLVGVIVTILITSSIIKTYEEGTNENFLKGYTSEVVTFTRDVIQGETITADMVTTVRIHNSTSPTNAVLYTGDVIGMVAKYNIAANTPAVYEMFANKLLTNDVRIQEISSVLLPSGLTEGEYIDIRIMYPSGVEYIVLTQKQVSRIYGSTIWMDMSEEEVLILNSAIVDSYMTNGSKLYAVRYSDPTTQIKLGDETQMESAEKYIKDKIAKEIADIGRTPTTAEMSNLISKYAIEYRYYIESYNKLETNYQPNEQIISYMKTNKYIVEQAREKLDAAARRSMERSIAEFENSVGDSYESIISGIGSAISEQQSLRGTLVQD